jgi:hypothetical protein
MAAKTGVRFRAALVLAVGFAGGLARGGTPPEFTQVDAGASAIDFKSILVAINCGPTTYEVRGVTFWSWSAAELATLCSRSFSNLQGTDWNAAWPNPFTDPELDQLDEVYQSIGFWDQPMWVEFKDLGPLELYKVQILFTANALYDFDHGGSLKVIGEKDQWIVRDFHLNTFARGIPFVVTVADIKPSAAGTIRLEYVREDDWVPAPALDSNKIWQGIMLSGAPIAFPTDLAVTKEGDSVKVSWMNHEPSTNGTPYDQIDILVDGQVRGVLGEGPAVVDEAKDTSFVFDVTKPENADLTAGAHGYQVRTTIGAHSKLLTAAFGIVPIRIAVGPYGGPFASITTSDGRVWTADTLLVTGDRQALDWQPNVDPVVGVAGIDQFGLDPLDPTDQSLFARFLFDSQGSRDNHQKVEIPVPNGAYDVRLYFWECDSPSIFDRAAQISIEGGPLTFAAYGDPDGIYAARPDEGWMLLFESVQVNDGRLDIDMLAGWGANGDVTLAAAEVLAADPAPKGPRNFRATTTGNRIYNLTWEIPAGASYDKLNILSRMSGQKESLADPTATSFTFEQEVDYDSTSNEGFVLQARTGNIFYAQLHAGAGVAPMYINGGGAGNVEVAAPLYSTTPRTARALTWVTDLGYVDNRHDFVAPLVSGDRHYVNWGDWNPPVPFLVAPDSPAAELDPPFENPDNLTGDEVVLMREIRWTETLPVRDPVYAFMRWDVPINNGTYTVRLYFGEGCCLRATDAAVEGSDPIRIYYNGLAAGDSFPIDRDYVVGALGKVALARFDDVAVSDGFLTITFRPFCMFGAPYDNNATVSAIEILPAGPPPELFKRGDVNQDGKINIADPVFLLSHLFASAPAPKCPDAADGNDDGKLNIADPIRILGHLFAGTGPLPDPFDLCGPDAEPGELGPCEFRPCVK